MIEQLEIQGLRGIKQLRLDSLAPLTVLVGKNGVGKSTILDALLIATSPVVGDALGRAVTRRAGGYDPQEFLFFQPLLNLPGQIKVTGSLQRECVISVSPFVHALVANQFDQRTSRESLVQLEVAIKDVVGGFQKCFTAFTTEGTYRYTSEGSVSALPVRLIEPTESKPFHSHYSELVTQGKRQQLKQLLKQLIPGFADVELLTTKSGRPTLYMIDKEDRAINVNLLGDGLVGFVYLALQLMTRQEALLLLEEPEVHQHPGLLFETARNLLETMREGKQVVLTTHSLELIDGLIHYASPDDLRRMGVIRLKKDGDDIFVTQRQGEDLKFDRETLYEDLR